MMTELPSTWDGPDHRRVLADRKRQAAKRALGKPTIKDAAVGPTALLDPALVAAARQTLARFGADDLAEMLGVA